MIFQVENAFQPVIALFTVIGDGEEIYLMIIKRDVGLEDLQIRSRGL
jgi:hypothetical protein